jgi:DNA-binding NarL/FixJ family response regulator
MKVVMLGNSNLINNEVVDILRNGFTQNVTAIKINAHPESKNLKCLYKAELIIIDLTSTNANSRILIGEIKELAPESKIILLNIYNQKTLIKQLIDAGASAYLHIDVLHKHLLTALTTVLENENYIATE